MIKKTVVFTLLLMLAATLAQAGWVIQEDNEGELVTVYISQNRIKNDDPAGPTILDLSRGTVTMLNPAARVYWTGTPEQFGKEMVAAMRAQFEKQLALVPQDQRAAMREAANKYLSPAKKKYRLEISGGAPGGRVAGFKTRVYEIRVDGRLVRKVWLTEDASILSEFKTGGGSAFMTAMAKAAGQGWQADPKIAKLMSRKFQVKEIEFQPGGGRSVSLVIKAQKRSLPYLMFQVPAGYRKAPLTEAMQ